MKKVLLIVLLASVINIQVALASSSTTKIYDKHHNVIGKVVNDGKTSKVYNKSNNMTDYYKRDGKKIKRYSKNGNLINSYKAED